MSPSLSLSASLKIYLAVPLGMETFKNFQALLQRISNSWRVIFLSAPLDIFPFLCMTWRLISAQCLWKRKLAWIRSISYQLSEWDGSTLVRIQSEDVLHNVVNLLLSFFSEGGSDEFFNSGDWHFTSLGWESVEDVFKIAPEWGSERTDCSLHGILKKIWI